MKIKEGIESVLVVEIADAIQNGRFSHHGAVQLPEGWDDEAIKKVDPGFRDAISSILDGDRIQAFVQDQIRIARLSSDDDYEIPEDGCPISNLQAFRDPLKFARSVVSAIAKLPYQYIIYAPLCEDLSDRAKRKDLDLKISDRARLVSGALIRPQIKTSHENAELDRRFRRKAKKDQTSKVLDNEIFFEYRTSGYIGDLSNSPIIAEFNEELRSLYGSLWNQNVLWDFGVSALKRTQFVISNQVVEDDREFCYADLSESDLHKCYGIWTRSAIDKRIEGGESLENILKSAVSLFQAKNARKLKAASSWFLKANLSRNLDRAIGTSIALEVLLGDQSTSDRIGLSKLMANRCAYALGANDEDREKLIAEFLEFYKLRSQIVHTGRTTLSSKEREVIDAGLSLAHRMLKDEIRRIA